MVHRWAQRLLPVALFVFSSWSTPACVAAQQSDTAEGLPSIESKTEGMQKMDGFVPVYFDEDDGKTWLEVDRWGEEKNTPSELFANAPHGICVDSHGDLYITEVPYVDNRLQKFEQI